MRYWCVVALAACSFSPGRGGGATNDGGADTPGDAATADAALDADVDALPGANCYAQWLDDTIQFSTPVAIAAVNTTSYERDPFLPTDELTLYLSSGRAGGTGGTVWVATRASLGAAFSTPIIVPEFVSDGDETKLSTTSDGLYAVLGSNRAGGMGGVDVWQSSRGSTAATWGAPTVVSNVNTAGSDHDPTISADGLRLYLAPSQPSPQHIALATRATVNDAFGSPTTIAALDSGAGDADPSPTPDERIILFSSGRAATPGGGNVWYATRASANDAFGTPRLVPGINTDADEGDPHLSSDGCRIYFGREIDDMTYDWDLYVAAAM